MVGIAAIVVAQIDDENTGILTPKLIEHVLPECAHCLLVRVCDLVHLRIDDAITQFSEPERSLRLLQPQGRAGASRPHAGPMRRRGAGGWVSINGVSGKLIGATVTILVFEVERYEIVFLGESHMRFESPGPQYLGERRRGLGPDVCDSDDFALVAGLKCLGVPL